MIISDNQCDSLIQSVIFSDFITQSVTERSRSDCHYTHDTQVVCDW